MIEQAIYLLLTVFIPLKLTYSALHYEPTQPKKQWAIYWAFYFGFKSLQWNFWLFQYRPVDFVFVLLAIWMYNDSYKGGLFIADFLTQNLGKIPAVADILNTISEKAKFIPLFEKAPVYGVEQKPKIQ